jgi:transcription antitermination protein NusB
MAEDLFATPSDDGAEAGDEKPPANNRRGGRQIALQALYWEASDAGDADGAVRDLADRFDLSPKIRDFALRLVSAVGEHRDRLDELISTTATHWHQDRMARLDSLILRLALAEILYCDDIPVPVSIDEAIELAKTYSTDQSYAFINGVLDAIVRQQGLSL